jgi:lipopolysaccharide export system protein LptC
MSARSARRFRLAVIFITAAILAVGSAWLRMVLKRSEADEMNSIIRTDPDYHLDNFRYFRLKATGEADYEMTGKKMTHYPDKDSMLINFPVMESLDQRKRLQVTYADWAYIEDENSKIHMHENVVVIRPPTPDSETFRMITEYLLVLPDEDIMRTDRKVVAYQGESSMTAVGMESNNATRELFLLSHAKVVYPPKQQKK